MAYQKQTDGNHIARGTIESRAAMKTAIESDRFISSIIEHRKLIRSIKKGPIVNTTVRLVNLDETVAKMRGLNVRDYKMARQYAIKQQARRDGFAGRK